MPEQHKEEKLATTNRRILAIGGTALTTLIIASGVTLKNLYDMHIETQKNIKEIIAKHAERNKKRQENITNIYNTSPCNEDTDGAIVNTIERKHSFETAVICPPEEIKIPDGKTGTLHRQQRTTGHEPKIDRNGAIVQEVCLKDIYTISAYDGKDGYHSPDWDNPKTWLERCENNPLTILSEKPESLKTTEETTIFGGTTTNHTYELFY